MRNQTPLHRDVVVDTEAAYILLVWRSRLGSYLGIPDVRRRSRKVNVCYGSSPLHTFDSAEMLYSSTLGDLLTGERDY